MPITIETLFENGEVKTIVYDPTKPMWAQDVKVWGESKPESPVTSPNANSTKE
jgi:hypothetical protein